jgi:DNA-binding GntR family transcriptional regulator
MPAAADLPDYLPADAAEPASLSERGYRLIRDRIISLQLRPGTLIEEQALMRELDLGRTPIREALNKLVNESLVTAIPRRGRVVSEINITDLTSISEVRLELEGCAARLAAQRATASERAAAETYRRALDELVEDFREERFMHLDNRIHRHLHRCTHNPFLDHTLERYLNLSLRLWFFRMDALAAVKDTAEAHPGVDEMRTILGAVIDGEPDLAEQTMRAHVTRFQREIHELLGAG